MHNGFYINFQNNTFNIITNTWIKKICKEKSGEKRTEKTCILIIYHRFWYIVFVQVTTIGKYRIQHEQNSSMPKVSLLHLLTHFVEFKAGKDSIFLFSMHWRKCFCIFLPSKFTASGLSSNAINVANTRANIL